MKKTILLAIALLSAVLSGFAKSEIIVEEPLTELAVANLCSKQGDFSQAIKRYAEFADRLTATQYNDYALCYWSMKKYDKGLQVARAALAKYPDYYQLYRTAMYCNGYLRQYAAALKDYEQLLRYAKTDSLLSLDYYIAGNCNLRLKDVTRATTLFNKLHGTKDIFTDKCLEGVPTDVAYLAEGYVIRSDYNNAAAVYLKHYKLKKDKRPLDLYRYANVYYDKANNKEISARLQLEGSHQADSALTLLQKTYPGYEPALVCYRRARVNWNIDASEKFTNGYAREHYERLITLAESVPEAKRKTFLMSSYHYLALYWLWKGNDRIKAGEYARMYKELNPADKTLDKVAALR